MIGLLKIVDMFTAAMLFFLPDSEICASLEKQDGPPALAFYGSGQACLLSWLGMVNSGCLSSMRSEIFLQMKFIIFQGCPTKQAAFLTWQPTSYNQFLIQSLLLVPEGYFA